MDKNKLLERFLRYAAIGTQSSRAKAAERTPSTDCQWELLRLLEKECREMGLSAELNGEGFLIARLASNLPAARQVKVPCVGFMAHVDTASDVPGTEVRPRVHENYGGGLITLSGGTVIDPADNPDLPLYHTGDTIVTSDGTSLLGADDKAGAAAIMDAAEYLLAHPEIPRGDVEFIFTPDEETGMGMDRFPLDKIHSAAAYTLDGDGEGTIEAECFTAWKVLARFTGKVIHIGHARGKLANAVAMACRFVELLPRSESPEATDGAYGYYCPMDIKGNMEEAAVEIFLRDFDNAEIRRRLDALKVFAAAVEAAFPGGKVRLEEEEQYRNMKDAFKKDPRVVSYLADAVRKTGMEPVFKSIRGGTDGARLSEKGIPTPNLFMGGGNFHSRAEWVSLRAMNRAAQTVVNCVRIWAENAEE